MTPHVIPAVFAMADPNAAEYTLISQCQATTPTNRARTNLGVGEYVDLSFNPPAPTNTTWTTTAGGLWTNVGSYNYFTAPSNAATATVTATLPGGAQQSISFNVVPPTMNVQATIISNFNYPAFTLGVGMTLNVVLNPTNVSFRRVQIMEVGQDATNMTGYFTNTSLFTSNPANLLRHNANTNWQFLDSLNSFRDYAYLSITVPILEFSPGSLTWQIPVMWMVGTSGSTNSLGQANQVFTIDANGTMTVTKYGWRETRLLTGAISTNSL